MTGFSFWQRWLLMVAVLISAFGALMVFASGTPLFDVFNRQVDPAFWQSNAVDEAARQFRAWIYGVWGATIVGWGVFVAFLAHFPFRRREKWAWNCLILGVSLWYLLDTALSVRYAVYFNAAFNTVLLVLVLVPLIFTRRFFDP